MNIYIAGPLFTKAQRVFNERLAELLEDVRMHNVFLPQFEVIYRDGDTARTIAQQCLNGLEASELVVAILDGAEVDSGAAFEIGYAYAKGKKIIGYRTDFRNMGDVSGFGINAMFSLCTQIVETEGELLDAINQL